MTGDGVHNQVGGQARVEQLVQAHIVHVHQYGGGAPPGRTVRQLPAERGPFVDRDRERALLRAAVARRADGAGPGVERPLIGGVSGLRGIGKTTLCVRLAHELADPHYPDGTCYADLDAFRSGNGVVLSDVLAELLDQLDDRSERGAADLRSLHGRYARHTAGRRLIVVLDNVRYEEELETLLPASAHSLVVVTGDRRLTGPDRGEGVVELPLEPLEERHAAELLRQLLKRDDARLADEAAVRDLLRICEGLPPLVKVAAGLLNRHPHSRLARLVERVRAEAEREGTAAMESLFAAAGREAGPDALLLFRLLAWYPAGHFPLQAAVAVLGRGEDAAADAVDDLVELGLLADREDGRLQLHGLMRGHARRLAERDGTAREASAAQARLIRWFRRQAERADRLNGAARLRCGKPLREPRYAPDVEWPDGAAALRWLHEERDALYGCVALAHARGDDTDVWALCEPLWLHFKEHPRHGEASAAFALGVESAGRSGHWRALIRMRCMLAQALWEQGRIERAERELADAGRAAGQLGEDRDDRLLLASVREFQGNLCAARGDGRGALAAYEASRAVHLAIGNGYGVLLQTHLMGKAAAGLGEWERAAVLLEEAHTRARELNRERMVGRTAHELARARRMLGDGGRAAELYALALENAGRRGADQERITILAALAELAEEAGDSGSAAGYRRALRELQSGES
ncbi:hypothetical protein HUT13_05240 [Streptomyces harbinensis]|uniref:NB-ARC domain-containing protein n=1 Tax=Streptomyces harbinensis TaxID=1176198 RepID=UPI001591F5EA|nr:NB-ARC domain-containing protein [Streptomyces harbinensis]QKV68245.1 hypothetical protein HUT13_05240 [Streptomyces harbinensis]